MSKDPERALAEAMQKLKQQRCRNAEKKRKREAKKQAAFNRSCFLVGKKVLTVFPELNGSGEVELLMLDRILYCLREKPEVFQQDT